MNGLNKLDKVSYYLSYTDCVPILNLPSAVVHLICAIRDRNLVDQSQKYPIPANESFRQLVIRKLDNWSHLKKGLLAITVIGSAILFHNWAKRKWEVHQLCKYAVRLGGKRSPILNDQEVYTAFLTERKKPEVAAVRWPNPFFCNTYFSFPRDLNSVNRKDKLFILSLIEKKLLSMVVFTQLDASLRNDPDIVSALIANSENMSNDEIELFYLQRISETIKAHEKVVDAYNLRMSPQISKEE